MNGALPPAELLRSAGAPHPAVKPDSSRFAYPTRLSAPQIWLDGLVEHPPSVVENLCGTARCLSLLSFDQSQMRKKKKEDHDEQ